MEQVKAKLPLKEIELKEELEKITAIAKQSFHEACTNSGVPEDDTNRDVHEGEMDEVLQLQWDFVIQENEKIILEIIQEKQNEFETQLRETVDELPTEDLLAYCDEHDKVVLSPDNYTHGCVLPDTEGPRREVRFSNRLCRRGYHRMVIV